MNALYLDLFSGISGDMFLGALLDLGVDLRRLQSELAKLGLHEFHLHASRQSRGAISGVHVDVHLEDDHHHEPDDAAAHHAHASSHHHEGHGHSHGRTFADIRELISRSALSDWVKQKAAAVFERVAIAEGKIHGQPPERVHFHEVGAVDSIVDIVGGCIALELLGKPRVLASGLTEGCGVVQCAHGTFPLPAPATLEILSRREVAVSQCSEPHELVTPTGAALLAEFAESFGPMHGLAVRRIGYGLGTRENQTRPNVLRALLCDPGAASHDWETDTIAVLKTNLDDVTAEILGAFVQKALAAGALDVFHTPIQMKKNRPGVLLTVLCAETDADRFSELLLRETTAFGVRRTTAERRKLRREFRTVQTVYGPVTVKLGWLDRAIVQTAPEFESCQAVAEKAGVALRRVYEAAVAAAASAGK